MVSKGAQHILLTGRRKPTSEAETIINDLVATGASVTSAQLDVSNYTDVSNLLCKLKSSNLPPLRGVMNMAGVLRDAPLLEQTEEKFEIVLKSKASETVYILYRTNLTYHIKHIKILVNNWMA
jgi:NAD(P)-dependent dehydrogenase (short-subunit alcohol dehydrogenase family)